ncbi:MAG: T9SS type A sorting domain-containing protein [Prevotella sp.]|nr:T9SS type A sorting domain-containing protein [Prevotella sp.]
MKNFISSMVLIAMGLFMFLSESLAQSQFSTPVSQMEYLKRGVVALKNDQSTGGVFVSWRLLGTDDPEVVFNVLRDGVKIVEGLANATCYVDQEADPDVTHTYVVETVLNGEVIETSDPITSETGYFHTLKLTRPTHSNTTYEYTPNDCTIADLDGDGEYEIIVKWDPSNSHDNSENGSTARVYIDAYKFDGTRMWRINLGYNIRAGAHYTQMLAYDFDGDGKAELIMKTGPGTSDGSGKYVSEASDDDEIRLNTDNGADYRNSNGHVVDGPEFLTIFNGETGAAIHTVYYNPNRAGGLGGSASYSGSYWGKSGDTGNRGERYLATVAYLDGPDENPSAVLCRGYYARAFVWAVDFDGQKLSTRWLHHSLSNKEVIHTKGDGTETTFTYSSNTAGLSVGSSTGSCTLFANGNHNLSCADVTGDGKDDIIWGSAALNSDGTLLYATGYGHGDAIHLSDLIPDRPGYEVFQIHEESKYGADVHDARTGEIIYSYSGSGDNGRGMAADVVDARGFECWSSNDRTVRSCVDGTAVSSKSQSQCFRLYWDGDPYDELFDGKYDSDTERCTPALTKCQGENSNKEYHVQNKTFQSEANGNCMTCNTTKATPNLIADLWGDWREEIIMWDYNDGVTLNIFTSCIPTEYRVPTLMHDHVYRLGVAWENVAYNQPPYLGYYLPAYLGLEDEAVPVGIKNIVSVDEGKIILKNSHTLEIQAQGEQLSSIEIFDVSGRKLWGKTLSISGTQDIALPEMTKGIYILKATSGGYTYQKKYMAE